jgi:hypothetical protein
VQTTKLENYVSPQILGDTGTLKHCFKALDEYFETNVVSSPRKSNCTSGHSLIAMLTFKACGIHSSYELLPVQLHERAENAPSTHLHSLPALLPLTKMRSLFKTCPLCATEYACSGKQHT